MWQKIWQNMTHFLHLVANHCKCANYLTVSKNLLGQCFTVVWYCQNRTRLRLLRNYGVLNLDWSLAPLDVSQADFMWESLHNWPPFFLKPILPLHRMAWEEAEQVAVDREDWCGRVAQCVFNTGWTQVRYSHYNSATNTYLTYAVQPVLLSMPLCIVNRRWSCSCKWYCGSI